MTKKQSWIKVKEHQEGLAGLAGLAGLLLLVFLIGIYPHSTSYICSKNPERCVCEEYRCTQDEKPKWFINTLSPCQNSSFHEQEEYCSKSRLKIQEEKDIDDCNSNPREDEKCKCEEYTKIYDISCQDKYNKKWVRQETDTPFIDTNDRIKLSYFFPYCFEGLTNKCTKSHPKTECEKRHFVEGKRIYIPPSNIIDGSGFETLCHQGGYEGEQCYEGNPDWMEDIEYKQEVNDTCFQKCYDSYPKRESGNANFITNVCNEKCWFNTNQTICREKTEVEKLMDKDCKFLQSELLKDKFRSYDTCPDNPPRLGTNSWLRYCEYLSSILRAWRQKGCKIV